MEIVSITIKLGRSMKGSEIRDAFKSIFVGGEVDDFAESDFYEQPVYHESYGFVIGMKSYTTNRNFLLKPTNGKEYFMPQSDYSEVQIVDHVWRHGVQYMTGLDNSITINNALELHDILQQVLPA